MSQSRIAAIERNPAVVSAGQLLALLKVLGVDLVLRDTTATATPASPLPNMADAGSQGVW